MAPWMRWKVTGPSRKTCTSTIPASIPSEDRRNGFEDDPLRAVARRSGSSATTTLTTATTPNTIANRRECDTATMPENSMRLKTRVARRRTL